MTRRDRDVVIVALRQPDARERFALCLLVALARAVAAAPPGTIDDLLALLAATDDREGRRE